MFYLYVPPNGHYNWVKRVYHRDSRDILKLFREDSEGDLWFHGAPPSIAKFCVHPSTSIRLALETL